MLYLIKSVDNGPLNEPADFDISELICQGKAIQCFTNIEFNIIYDISSGFYQECDFFSKYFARIVLSIFPDYCVVSLT